MSHAPRPNNSWIGQNYDKIILFVILLALLGSALVLVLQIGKVRQSLTKAQWEIPPITPLAVQPIELEGFYASLKSLENPFQAQPSAKRMMISEMRKSCVGPECGKPIQIEAKKCPYCNAEQPVIRPLEERDTDGDGIPDVVELEFGMNPFDLNDAALDLDADGFTNLEEHLSGTGLNEPKDFPPPIAKLRTGRIRSNPFMLRFEGDAKMGDGSVVYQLNLRSLEKTYFVGVGDEAEGFKVVEYQEQSPEGPAIILKTGDTRIRLPRGKVREGHELVADMVFLIDKSILRLRAGEVFKLKDLEYKVLEMRRDSVLVRDIASNKDTLVGPLSDSEKSALMSGSAQAARPPAPGMPSR